MLENTSPTGSHPVYTAYKRVDRKVRPVPGIFPEDAKVIRQIPEDPLLTLPPLSPNPPDFQPTVKMTYDRIKAFNLDADDFLWPEEVKLFQHIILLNERVFAFHQSERGTFREDYFSPYIYPVIPHVPWVHRNIPIPPGIRDKVISLLKEKIDAGVYEPSQSSYRSKWFCTVKKDGSLRIVHDLQPLNAVSIRDAGLPPILDDFVEPFAGCQIYTVFDLYWGYDARKVALQSRDLTTFQSPIGPLRLTSLAMGYTNAITEFQTCTTFVLKDEIPRVANVFVDDCAAKGASTTYPDENGNPETIPQNPGIRRFVWEHAQDVHRIMHRIACSGATFAPKKTQMARPQVVILGQKCTPEGRLPDDSKVSKIRNWPVLRTTTEVRGFLGLCGTVRIWIKDYSSIIRPLTELYRKDTVFIWDERRQEAFDYLKDIISSAPALRSIDYRSKLPVTLAVDSSIIAIGIILSQIDENGKRRPARYGSIPINAREANYSQPKLELYGLFRALRHFRLYLIGVHRLHVEVDAKYIKGMLNEPDLQPNATINRWIQGILLFDFTLIHVPAANHKGPDGLSRRIPTEDDLAEEQESDDWLDDIALYCTYTHFSDPIRSTSSYDPLFISTDSTQDDYLRKIFRFLQSLIIPSFDTTQQRKRFLKRTAFYYIKNGQMYRRRPGRTPLVVVLDSAKRLEVLIKAHEELGHRGVYGTFGTLRDRFFWPHLFTDVKHHVASCDSCQKFSTRKVEIPLTVSASPTLFSKVYVDIMFMPKAGKFRYIVAARDDLTQAAEGRALARANSKALANFFWEEIICRYGVIGEVVTDNGKEVQGAFTILMDRYGIPQIKISEYNSKANGVVERGHFIIRQSLIKVAGSKISSWPTLVPHAFFADKCTTRRSTGFSPFYLLHGVHPVLPFDLTEATFMVDGFHQNMSSIDLLTLRIRQLAKREDDLAQASDTITRTRIASKEVFERKFAYRLRQEPISPGSLVLVRNNRVEKSLDKKDKQRYLGPFEVVRLTRGGSYVLKELDGSIMRHSFAAFRLLPYLPRLGSEITPDSLDDLVDSHDPDPDSDADSNHDDMEL